MQLKGISSTVEILPRTLRQRFSGATAVAIKLFNAPSEQNLHTEEDYLTEVAAMQVLHHYRRQLPFSITQLSEHGRIPYDENDKKIAYIKMPVLRHVSYDNDPPHLSQANYIKRIGQALADLHRLQITPAHQSQLFSTPQIRLQKRLQTHPMALNNPDEIDEAIIRLNELRGPQVFVHRDAHIANTCAITNGGKLTGLMDFGLAGMAVKEFDIFPFIGKSCETDAFIEGYYQNDGAPIDEHNMQIIREAGACLSMLKADLTNKQQANLKALCRPSYQRERVMF